MRYFIEIRRISEEDAFSGSDTFWGTKLSTGEIFAWEAPMVGDGGASQEMELAAFLAEYANPGMDPSEGPDEAIFQTEGEYFHITITPK